MHAGVTSWRRRPGRWDAACSDIARSAEAEPPPETTTLRIGHSPSLCAAPQFVAEDLLRGEGFTSVTYVKSADAGSRAVA